MIRNLHPPLPFFEQITTRLLRVSGAMAIVYVPLNLVRQTVVLNPFTPICEHSFPRWHLRFSERLLQCDADHCPAAENRWHEGGRGSRQRGSEGVQDRPYPSYVFWVGLAQADGRVNGMATEGGGWMYRLVLVLYRSPNYV